MKLVFRAPNQAFETKIVKTMEGSDCTKQAMLPMEQRKHGHNKYHILIASKKYFDVLVLIISTLAIIIGYQLLFKRIESGVEPNYNEIKDNVLNMLVRLQNECEWIILASLAMSISTCSKVYHE